MHVFLMYFPQWPAKQAAEAAGKSIKISWTLGLFHDEMSRPQKLLLGYKWIPIPRIPPPSILWLTQTHNTALLAVSPCDTS